MPETQKTCRICHKPFREYAMGEKNGYKLVACSACGSVMTSPWLTPADLDAFFGDVQPEIVHLPNPQLEIGRLKKLIGKIMKKASGAPLTPELAATRRFLDISCRQGYAVMAAKEMGFQAHGIDPHDFFIAFAKDKYDPALFTHTTVSDYAAGKQQADVIFSVESLCEQHEPDAYLDALTAILAPGGTLYLQEPDGNSYHLPRKFTNWGFVDPPLNFAYISRKGMDSLLDRHGLKVREALFTWSPFMRLLVVKKGA